MESKQGRYVAFKEFLFKYRGRLLGDSVKAQRPASLDKSAEELPVPPIPNLIASAAPKKTSTAGEKKSDKAKKAKPSLPKPGILETYVREREATPIQENLVVWESHAGAGMICHPLALFREFMTRDYFAQWQHVWIIENPSERTILSAEFKHLSNVSFVAKKSSKYSGLMAVARLIICNTSLPLYFSKRPGQYIVNTWHSLTVKKLGYDQPNGAMISRNIIRSLLATDLLLSPNKWMSEIFLKSYKMEGIFSGEIIENCNPRITLANVSLDELHERLAVRGIVISRTKPIILYAPTWRDTTTVDAELERLASAVSQLKLHAEPLGYQVLVKPHHVTYTHLSSSGVDMRVFVPPTIDVNFILSHTSILITDYSSVFYDFLGKKRPIFFYIPDLEAYEDDRGLYLKPAELPGPTTKSLSELVEWIRDPSTYYGRFTEAAASMCAWAVPDDAQVSCRLVNDLVFGSRQIEPELTFGSAVLDSSLPTPYLKYQVKRADKKSVLIYGGHFRKNGVLASLISLLNHVDTEAYDFTVFFMNPDSADETQIPIISETLQRLPQEIRVVIRIGERTLRGEETAALRDAESGLLNGSVMLDDPSIKSLTDREFRRCLGDAKFDVAIDFSGYGIYFPLVIASAKPSKLIIWQHNDLAADLGNSHKRGVADHGNGATPAGLIQLYKCFDYMVSCTNEIMEVNRSFLSADDNYHKFVAVENVIDVERVQSGRENRYCFPKSVRGGLYRVSSSGKMEAIQQIDSEDNAVYCDCDPFDSDGFSAVVTNIDLPKSGWFNFVTIGRYSPEKNHVSLIEAFSEFQKIHKNSRLYIIGSGPLKDIYVAMRKSLGLESSVYLTGNLQNPFGLASLCNCFIFPSHYEGMGLVVLEARLLGLSIICSDFHAVHSVVDRHVHTITGHTAADLLNAMEGFARGDISLEKNYSLEGRTEKAVKQFHDLIS